LTLLPRVAQGVAVAVLPLTHIVNITRSVVSGRVEPILGLNPTMLLLISLTWIIIVAVFFFILSINLMKKRLIS
jgi:lipooligosaccharide transport system permease protein